MRLIPVVALLLLTTTAARAADDVAALPLGDPARAYELVGGDAGQWLDLAGPAKEDGSRVVELDALAPALSKADVVLLGEHHTNGAGHEQQAKLLEALVKTGRPIALGMEFFESEDDAALARFVDGKTDLDTMLIETGWYDGGGFNFEYYRPQVEIARAAKAPIFGVNVPRTVIRTISREGLDKLSEKDRALVGDLGETDTRHRFVVDTMMGGAAASMGPMFDGMYRGQRAWDSVMANSVLRARAKGGVADTAVSGGVQGRLIVVIVGVGHVGHGLGIPQRLRASDPKLDVRVVVPVVAEKPPKDAMMHPGMEPTESATFSRGYGDVACVLPDDGGAEPYPTYGITLEAKDGPLSVTKVEAGSVAARAGVQKGDVLTAINGADVSDVPHARLALAKTRWSDRTLLSVKRGDQALVVPVLVLPPPDGPGRWMKSEPLSPAPDGFDPRMRTSLAKSESVGGARLVTFQDEPVRVDVLAGDLLLESWQLDASGRPAKGMLASPASDGAVRVEIERDASGAVTAEHRFDLAGKEISPAAAR